MLFNSIHFLIFFPVVITLYFLLPYRYRQFFLVASSFYFYMCWKANYIFLILISGCIDYFAAIFLEKSENPSVRKRFLILSMISNLGLLFVFKYFNFFNSQFRILFQWMDIPYGIPEHTLLLPVGISFYTFQTMAYTIDVYRKTIPAEKNFITYLLYVSFFPQLVAGPIERAERLLPQFHEKQVFEYRRVTDGLKLMLWGFFKKIVISDNLALFVNPVYNNPHNFSGPFLTAATIAFAFQIYCDFSGYSDIGIGAAQVMGIRLMDNFNRPYFSKSISEFWKRWHISLSTWFKDYLYIALGGNRVSKARWYFNLFATFFISGIWHGANWTFVVWGALNGFYLVSALWFEDTRKKIYLNFKLHNFPQFVKYGNILWTFSLTCFAWIFFRANTMTDAVYIVKNLLSGWNTVINRELLRHYLVLLDLKYEYYIPVICAVLFMESIHILQRHNRIRHMLSEYPVWVRWPIYYIMLYFILIFGEFGGKEFIYFQF